jgi:hypothetical protein
MALRQKGVRMGTKNRGNFQNGISFGGGGLLTGPIRGPTVSNESPNRRLHSLAFCRANDKDGGLSMRWHDDGNEAFSEMEGLLAALEAQDSTAVQIAANAVLKSAYNRLFYHTEVPLIGDGAAMSTLLTVMEE